jgi:hypothetical protein
LILLFALAGILSESKPPKQEYDASRQFSIYRTGDVRTGGLTGMGAEFEFPGKKPSRPSFVKVSFGALRVHTPQDSKSDEDLLVWKDTKKLSLRFGPTNYELPLIEAWNETHNKLARMIYGHALEEHVDVQMTVEQFLAFANANEVTVTIGQEQKIIRFKSLGPVRQLAKTIPNAN